LAFLINLVLVAYLVWSKRLFGARGGKQAYEARPRTDSFIEVEQAALTATRLAEQPTVPAERPTVPDGKLPPRPTMLRAVGPARKASQGDPVPR
jgi:hypothetical protein